MPRDLVVDSATTLGKTLFAPEKLLVTCPDA